MKLDMNKKINTEKEFSENLDSMLTGQKPEVSAVYDDDFRTALNFASKIIELRPLPQPEFEVKLKQRLLSRLASDRRKVKSRWFLERWGDILTAPVWRTVTTAAVIIIMLVAGAFWALRALPRDIRAPENAPMFAPTAPSAPSTTPTPSAPMPVTPSMPPLEDNKTIGVLSVNATPDKSAYLPGEIIDINFSFTNTSPDRITIESFPPEIRIMSPDPSNEVLVMSAGDSQVNLGPGETVNHLITVGTQGGNSLTPGWYEVDVDNVDIDVTATRATTSTNMSYGGVANFLVEYPQGAMEKIIEVNQSQAVNGISINLERIKLTEKGVSWYAFTTASVISSPQPPGPVYPQPIQIVGVPAEYAIDGISRDAGYANFNLLENGTLLTWGSEPGLLPPVPADAREMTIRITAFGDIQGPWEFYIPLQ